MTRALLLVDIQNDYFPGGAMELPGSTREPGECRDAASGVQTEGHPVVHMQHISTRRGATFFLPDTPGVRIHESVTPAPGETVFQKNHPNGFRGTPLLDHLRGSKVTELVIAGMMTQMGIDTTTRAAADLGFRCLLAHDGCAASALAFGGVAVPAETVHTAFIAALNGIFAGVLSADEICKGL
jgi:nicotinamidase-related amidase